jgi:succinate dehydrogenase / fumarate reductase iron-sulfur subunit
VSSAPVPGSTTIELALKIWRYDAETGKKELKRYEVEAPDWVTLLDVLDIIKDKQDGTLAYRKSCRMMICGSCGMRMDGAAVLACKTRMYDIAKAGHVPVISSMGNMPVIKDLVVDMDPFWGKVRRMKPWLDPGYEEPLEKERIISQQQMNVIHKEALCIMCGCCVSECNSMESDPDFLGPAALAKAQRFVGDQREDDDDRRARLKDLNGAHGIWECTRCYFCNQRCPKGVDPRDAIAKLGAETFRFGAGSEVGAKTNMFAPVGTLVEPGVAHAQVFVDSTRKGGFLDETQLVPKTIGPLAAALDVPFALRLARAGKVPNPLRKHKAKNNDEVKRLWKLLEQQARGHEGLGTNHPSLIDSHD